MGLCVSVACVLKPMLEVGGEREEKKYCWKAQKNQIMSKFEKKCRLERNNKERLKNNILIKI